MLRPVISANLTLEGGGPRTTWFQWYEFTYRGGISRVLQNLLPVIDGNSAL